MPTPAEIKTQESLQEAGRILSWQEELKKCRGWTEYLEPKIFSAFDAARTRILDAHAAGKAPESKDLAVFQGFHEVVTAMRSDQASSQARFSTSPRRPH